MIASTEISFALRRPGITLIAVAAMAALVVLLTAAREPRNALGYAARRQAQPTPTVGPTPTPTTPTAEELLAQATGNSAAKGSVQENGTFRSSNNSIYDGFKLWANFSWQHGTFQDHRTFTKPAYLNKTVGFASDVRRIAVATRLAIRVHGRWSCQSVAAAKNSSLWQPPRFDFNAGRRGHDDTERQPGMGLSVGGTPTASRAIRSTSRLTFSINQASSLYKEVRESGWVRDAHDHSAQVTGTVLYSVYGNPAHVSFPKHCHG